MNLRFSNELIEWRGPAPFYFVAVPDAEAQEIKDLANRLSYGWGVIPVTGVIGKTEFTTSLFPKDGRYLVPIKNMVRIPENLNLGDQVEVQITLAV